MKLFDVRSAIAGAGLVAGIFGLVSMMQAPSHLPPFQILGVPTPEQMRVVEGQPFTVPHGKVFVVTGLGDLNSSITGWVGVIFDGTTVLRAKGQHPVAVPPGLVAGPGTVVETSDSETPLGVTLGYLADA